MSDTNISINITDTILKVIKNTKLFEKTERTKKIMIGIGVVCVFNFILTGMNYFSINSIYDFNKKNMSFLQDMNKVIFVKEKENVSVERKSIRVSKSTSTTDLDQRIFVSKSTSTTDFKNASKDDIIESDTVFDNTIKSHDILQCESILYDYYTIER